MVDWHQLDRYPRDFAWLSDLSVEPLDGLPRWLWRLREQLASHGPTPHRLGVGEAVERIVQKRPQLEKLGCEGRAVLRWLFTIASDGFPENAPPISDYDTVAAELDAVRPIDMGVEFAPLELAGSSINARTLPTVLVTFSQTEFLTLERYQNNLETFSQKEQLTLELYQQFW